MHNAGFPTKLLLVIVLSKVLLGEHSDNNSVEKTTVTVNEKESSVDTENVINDGLNHIEEMYPENGSVSDSGIDKSGEANTGSIFDA